MVTLWERVTGYNLPDNSTLPEEQKLPIHGFWGIIQEWESGYETQSNVLDYFNLVGDQITDGATIKQHINAAPDKTRFLRMCKDWSYVGEIVTDPLDPNAGKYLDWSQFVLRMAAEVSDQGGTPP